ncbi:MAG: SH3 domain-containing protein [Cyanobacteriota bacterium]|nr:SH3 domain-containing protein [Cyanobacteriota bacterium]
MLSFALVAPAALPAGGAERRSPEVRRRQAAAEPLLASSALALQCAPQQQAPVLAPVAIGEPLRVLRRWAGDNGQRWLQVELVGGAPGSVRRGWLLG